jgi:L-alanine-DL-glutamate epimerase-like enolase superfamily enzyme
MKEGYLDIPKRPGLGINLNLEFVEKHALRDEAHV